jgi:hypothetical protein
MNCRAEKPGMFQTCLSFGRAIYRPIIFHIRYQGLSDKEKHCIVDEA